ncbi:MAG: 3-hydroxyacyl-CoA dehydrogenase family protein [Syntrophales bacterium]|nr:3-hydroxyacyl-CoA dehydrogenase family protein [Syntrophales bacterium]
MIGAGLMGHGIAQVFAAAGYTVRVFDQNRDVLEKTKERIRNNFRVFINLGLRDERDVEICLDRIVLCRSIEDLCGGCQYIIEAITENIEIKRQTFSAVEKLVDEETILTTNTSAISITDIGIVLKNPSRFLGTHFWNPPYILPCVEVIRGRETSDETFEKTCVLLESAGKVPVRVNKDIPGFLGNRLQHAMWREAFSLCDRGIATPEDIDKVVKYGFGARMFFLGPMETADLAGLDLTKSIHEYLFPFLETSNKPAAILEKLVSEGALGVKTGRGFYNWTDKMIESAISERDMMLLKVLSLVCSYERK